MSVGEYRKCALDGLKSTARIEDGRLFLICIQNIEYMLTCVYTTIILLLYRILQFYTFPIRITVYNLVEMCILMCYYNYILCILIFNRRFIFSRVFK